MELIDIIPEFNLYEEYWKIYTKSDTLPPQYISKESVIEKSIIGEGSNIYGQVFNSVIGCGVTIGKGTVVRDSIIMNEAEIGDECSIEKAIIAENVTIGNRVTLGAFDEKPNETDPTIYTNGIVTIGEWSKIPDNITIGKNSMVSGITEASDYENGKLESGRTFVKAGD